jgi:hypothetical protein
MHGANLRDGTSTPYHEQTVPPEFRAYAHIELVPPLNLGTCPHTNKRLRKVEERRRVALHCIHAAVLAGADGCVADGRTSRNELRVAVWDALVAAGLVTKQTGSEASGCVTRYRATGRLLDHFKDWPLAHVMNLKLERNSMSTETPVWDGLVVLRARKRDGGGLLPWPEEERDAALGGVSVAAYLESVEDDIERINRSNLRHTWEAYRQLDDGRYRAIQPQVCVKQLHTGHLLHYARLYTWGTDSAQGLSAKPERYERQMMRIDGEPVAELDYKCYHPRLLYNLCGHDPAAEADLYRPEEVLPRTWEDVGRRKTARAFVKLAFNICLNTTGAKAAAKGVRGLLWKEPNSPAYRAMLQREGLNADAVVARMIVAHHAVAHRFFTEIGGELQTIDGVVMRHILMAFAMEDRPVLPLHDSVVCRASDAGFAEAMMRLHYHATVGFWPVIKRVF